MYSVGSLCRTEAQTRVHCMSSAITQNKDPRWLRLTAILGARRIAAPTAPAATLPPRARQVSRREVFLPDALRSKFSGGRFVGYARRRTKPSLPVFKLLSTNVASMAGAPAASARVEVPVIVIGLSWSCDMVYEPLE